MDAAPPPHGALQHKFAGGETCYTAWVGQNIAAAEILARLGFDAVTIDLQHGRIDVADAIQGISVLRGMGVPTIVRIPVGDFQTASRVLDFGASAIIAPMINSAEEARQLLSFCKYPPLGERSWGPYGALSSSGLAPAEYLQSANSDGVVLAMIETMQALDNLEEIIGVEGIDGVFVGPSDLSIALSRGDYVDPTREEVVSALDQVVESCAAAGKVATLFSATPAAAASAAAAGFRLIAVGDDVSLLSLGAETAMAEIRSFENVSR